MSLYTVLLLLLNIYCATHVIGQCCKDGSCVFEDGSGNTLDLSAFGCRTLIFSDDDEYDYKYTPCGNRDNCMNEGESVNGMMVQESRDGSFCAQIAVWDDGDSTPSYNENTGEWQLRYTNGDLCFGSPREFTAVFQCNEHIEEHVNSIVEPVTCQYIMIIETKYACPNTPYKSSSCSSDDSSDLSGGSIFLIILFCGFFLYCVFGYLFMALVKNKADGGAAAQLGNVAGNIPNKSFWQTVPKLFLAGCFVTHQWTMSLFGKSYGGVSQSDDTATGAMDDM